MIFLSIKLQIFCKQECFLIILSCLNSDLLHIFHLESRSFFIIRYINVKNNKIHFVVIVK